MMVRLLADENLNTAIITGIRRLLPLIDFIRVQDMGLSGASDPDVLTWAATDNRVVVTHDLKTMPDFAYTRVQNGEHMPGLIGIRRLTPVGQAISELHLMLECYTSDDFENTVKRIPLA